MLQVEIDLQPYPVRTIPIDKGIEPCGMDCPEYSNCLTCPFPQCIYDLSQHPQILTRILNSYALHILISKGYSRKASARKLQMYYQTAQHILRDPRDFSQWFPYIERSIDHEGG